MTARCISLLILIAVPFTLQAASIPVPNHSFEQPAVSEQQAAGWTSNSGQISGGVAPASVSGGFTVADDGSWFHYLNLPSFLGPNPSVTESNGGLISNAATGTYTLTVAAGHRINGATTDGSYLIELLAGGNVIASQTLNNPLASIPVDAWQDMTAVGVVNPGDAADGQDLTIRLSAYDGTGGIASQGQFDNVRLDYEPAHIFTVSSRQILLDGQPFEVNGVCYQPAAIGENPSTGYYYVNRYIYGDYFFDGAGLDYESRWARDFENFRKLGLNVIRIYGWDPGLDHTTFFNLAASNGIYVLINRWVNKDADFGDPAVVAALVAEWESIATPLADNPVVMGFLIGNEANSWNPDFWSAMNTAAAAVKSIAPNKLVSSAITDRLDQVGTYEDDMTAFDFWAIQVYKGSSFYSYFDAYKTNSIKPLIITEYGYDALDGRSDTEWPNNAKISADAVESLINELRADEAGDDICSGGCVFAYADEWWKDTNSIASNFAHDFGPPYTNWAFADGEANEEWWGIFRTVDNGNDIDILEPRALFYRLAAMWNDPFSAVLATSLSGQDLQMTFSYPAHLRDQHLIVEGSSDLISWTTVADNANNQYLVSAASSVSVVSSDDGTNVTVTLVHDADAPPSSGPQNLLTNGDFEEGNLTGWSDSGYGYPTDAFSESGTYSMALNAPGGFVAPSAYQTVSASPGDEFYLSGFIFAESPLPADATFGILKMVFNDIGGNPIDLNPATEISIGTRAAAPYFGAESTPVLNTSTTGAWLFSHVLAIAPAGTESVSFFIINVDQSPSIMYFDTLEAIDWNAPGLPTGPAGPNAFFRCINNGR